MEQGESPNSASAHTPLDDKELPPLSKSIKKRRAEQQPYPPALSVYKPDRYYLGIMIKYLFLFLRLK
ncbi:hypothetical protein KA005_68785, partial [bacterium]|nr:hypothetical protein [bacterium]